MSDLFGDMQEFWKSKGVEAAPAPVPGGGSQGNLAADMADYWGQHGVKVAAPTAPAPPAHVPAATQEVKSPAQPPQPAGMVSVPTTPENVPKVPGGPEMVPGAPRPVPFAPAPVPKEPSAPPEAQAPVPQPVAAPAPEAPGERNILGEAGASIMRGVGSVAAMPRGFLGAFDIKTGPTEALAKSGKELAEEYPESPSVSGGISASKMANPKWWASTLPGLAVQILPIIAAAAGVTLAAPEAAIGGIAAGTLAGEAAGGVIGTSMAGQAMLDYEEHTGKEIPTYKKIIIGLGAGTAGALLPGMTVGRMVEGKMVSEAAENALLKVFGNETAAKAIAERAITAASSGGSMAGFSVIENAFEKYGYNPDKELTQGVFESLVLGTMMGGIHGEIRQFKKRAAEQGESARLDDYFKSLTLDLQGAYEEAHQTLKTQYGGGAGQVIGEAPPEAKPILDQAGRPASPDDVQAALAKQPFERNAHEKFLADQAQKEARGEIQPPAVPGPTDIIPGTAARERANVTEPSVERLQRAVDVVGDSDAGKKLGDLLTGNQDTLANAFRAPGEAPGIPEITDKIMDLAQKVEDTGDPNAAKELHDFINSNLGALKGLPRWPVASTEPVTQPMGLPTSEGAKVAATPPPGPEEAPPAAATEMVSKGMPSVNPAGRSNEVPESLPKEAPPAGPRFSEPAANEPPSGAHAQPGGAGNVGISPTPAETPKKRGAMVAPKPGVVDQPMGQAGGTAEGNAAPGEVAPETKPPVEAAGTGGLFDEGEGGGGTLFKVGEEAA